MVCVPAALGGVYKPELDMVPTLELPPAIPSTDHVTLAGPVPVNVAENCCDCFKVSAASRGLTKMLPLLAAGFTVTCALAVFDVSALDTAVTVT